MNDDCEWLLPFTRVLGFDRLDFDFGERLAVTVFLAVAFAAFFVENDDFVTFHVTQNAGADRSTFDIRYTDGHFAVIVEQVHGVEGNRISFIGCQPVDEDLLTFLNFELLTGDGNDCEHVDNQKIKWNENLFLKKARKGRICCWKNQVLRQSKPNFPVGL